VWQCIVTAWIFGGPRRSRSGQPSQRSFSTVLSRCCCALGFEEALDQFSEPKIYRPASYQPFRTYDDCAALVSDQLAAEKCALAAVILFTAISVRSGDHGVMAIVRRAVARLSGIRFSRRRWVGRAAQRRTLPRTDRYLDEVSSRAPRKIRSGFALLMRSAPSVLSSNTRPSWRGRRARQKPHRALELTPRPGEGTLERQKQRAPGPRERFRSAMQAAHTHADADSLPSPKSTWRSLTAEIETALHCAGAIERRICSMARKVNARIYRCDWSKRRYAPGRDGNSLSWQLTRPLRAVIALFRSRRARPNRS